MTFIDARKELKSYIRIIRQEEVVFEEINRLRDKCMRITTTYSDMPKGSYNVHKLENTIAEFVDETNRLLGLLNKELDLKKIIQNKLDLIEDEDYNYRILLTKRYILNKPIRQIAREMNYTERWTIKLINNAISKYANL